MLKNTNYFVVNAIRRTKRLYDVSMIRNVIEVDDFVNVVWNITCYDVDTFVLIKNEFITSLFTSLSLDKTEFSITQDGKNFIIGYSWNDFEKNNPYNLKIIQGRFNRPYFF